MPKCPVCGYEMKEMINSDAYRCPEHGFFSGFLLYNLMQTQVFHAGTLRPPVWSNRTVTTRQEAISEAMEIAAITGGTPVVEWCCVSDAGKVSVLRQEEIPRQENTAAEPAEIFGCYLENSFTVYASVDKCQAKKRRKRMAIAHAIGGRHGR